MILSTPSPKEMNDEAEGSCKHFNSLRKTNIEKISVLKGPEHKLKIDVQPLI